MLACPEMSAERTAGAHEAGRTTRPRSRAARPRSRSATTGSSGGHRPRAVQLQDRGRSDALDLMFALHLSRADFTASDDSSASSCSRSSGARRRRAQHDDRQPRLAGPVASCPTRSPISPGVQALTSPRATTTRAAARGYPEPRRSRGSAAYTRFDTQPQVVAAPDPDDPSARPCPCCSTGRGRPTRSPPRSRTRARTDLIPAAITLLDSPTRSVRAGEVVRSDSDSFHPDAALWGTRASYICSYDIHTQTRASSRSKRARSRSSPADGRRPGPSGASRGRCPTSRASCRPTSPGPVPALLFRGDLTPSQSAVAAPGPARPVRTTSPCRSRRSASGLLASGPPCLSALAARVPRAPHREARHRVVREEVTPDRLRRSRVTRRPWPSSTTSIPARISTWSGPRFPRTTGCRP